MREVPRMNFQDTHSWEYRLQRQDIHEQIHYEAKIGLNEGITTQRTPENCRLPIGNHMYQHMYW